MLFCLGLISVLPIITLLRFVIWLVIGLSIYYLYGFRHSVLGTGSKGAPEGGEDFG
jgi:APA family basic amino acid/polyamine antiporter